MRLLTACLVLLLACLFVPICSAQDVYNEINVGTPPNGLFHGGEVDSVQLGNGNLHIEIPLWTVAGRGPLAPGAIFVLDTKEWTAKFTTNKQTGDVTVLIQPELNGTFKGVVRGLHYTRQSSTFHAQVPSCPAYSSNFVIAEANGTKHHFVPDPGDSCLGTLTWPVYYADDGSGFTLSLTRSGIQFVSETDTNGNQLTSTTDTLGRTLADGTLTYYDNAGTAQTIQVTGISVPINTHLCQWVEGVNACQEYTSTKNEISQIRLPNGMTYTINYVQNDEGEPSSITLPSGAQISWTYNSGDEGGPAVATRTVTANGQSSTWTYNYAGSAAWLTTDQRTTNSVTKTTTYQNNFAGLLATLTYPSGRVITYTSDGAGRMSKGQDIPNSVNYVTGTCANGTDSLGVYYTPPGSPSSLLNGASLVSTFYYDKRLQPCRISAKSTGTAPLTCTDTAVGNVLDFTYNFNLGAGDNGNVVSITNNRDTTRSQSFTYDPLNRLATARTTSTTGSTCWDEAFGYDPWGNPLSIGRISGYTCSNEELLSITATTNNQISGDTFDAAGNLITIPAIANYTYDAENHLKTAAGVTYTYDGDGKRVEKSNGKLYWYGTSSDPLDETDLAGNTNNSSFFEYIFFGGKRIARRDYQNNVNYYFADHLGTARVVTNASGTILDDSDFYPFGGERAYLNSSPQNYKFTGKERDSESGLDNFGLRYLGSSMGRFMSPDSIANDWELQNPQTWNRYVYARNNPLAYVDPDGAAVELICTTSSDKCAAQREQELAALQNSLGNKDAASRLYINEVKDGDNTRYFVGIKGDVGDFESLSGGAKDLGEIVGAKQVVEFGLTDKDLPGAGKGQGSYTYAPGEIGNANPRVLVNPGAVASASIFFSNTVFGGSRFGPGKVRDTTTGIAAFHEFGHVWKMWQNINAAQNGVIPGANGIDPRLNTSSEAVRWENRMRQQLYGPFGPNNAERKVHD